MFLSVTSRRGPKVPQARPLGSWFRGQAFRRLPGGFVSWTKPTWGPAGPSTSLTAHGPESCLDMGCSFFCF